MGIKLFSVFNSVWKCKLSLVFVLIGGLAIQNHRLCAGELDDFEEDATEPKNGQYLKKTSGDESSFFEDFFRDIFSEILGDMLSGWYQRSLVMGKSRPLGDQLLPIFKADLNYQNVEHDIRAIDAKIELGHGPLGIQFRRTHFSESEPRDKLIVTKYYGLLRFSGCCNFELDFGLGGLTLHGNETNTAFSLAIPFKIYPERWVGVCFLPSWSFLNRNVINDYDISVPFTIDYFSIQIGYRWVESLNESLNGPYIGGSVCF